VVRYHLDLIGITVCAISGAIAPRATLLVADALGLAMFSVAGA
jgi:uncharacterized membrane protein YeiH